MTLLVGVVCEDGVVIATDSFATYGEGGRPTIGQQPVTKVQRSGDAMIYAFTGAIGMAQVLAPALDRLAQGSFNTNPGTKAPAADAMKIIAAKIHEETKGLISSARDVAPLVGEAAAGTTVLCKTLLGVCWGRPRLLQFDFSGAPEQVTDELRFVTLGSGQGIADPFMAFLKRILWGDRRPNVTEARMVAAWTVRHVSKTCYGGVGGDLQMASMTMDNGKPKVDVIRDALEHRQAVDEAEEALRVHVLEKRSVTPPAPEPPTPPKA